MQLTFNPEHRATAPILIVEDDVDQLSVLAGMLSREPWPLITAITGEHALELLRTTIPALAIVDLVLPDIPGAQVIRYIRGDERLSRIKIILMTSQPRYVTEADRRLSDLVLFKPVDRETLVQSVRDLLGVEDDTNKSSTPAQGSSWFI
jgi:DNA-binding NtrC family response regulator